MKINNNIQEDYCSFEVSKLLKEKGFNVITDYFTNDIYKNLTENINSLGNKDSNSDFLSRPTHALAIKWIRENFGYHIEIGFDAWNTEKYNYSICRKAERSFHYDELDEFISSEIATEAALLYTLTRLIK